MNDIEELVEIIRSFGGEASLYDIVNAYGKKYRMIIQPQHKKVIKQTLESSSHYVLYNESTEQWGLAELFAKESNNVREKRTESGSVQVLRNAVYNWATEKIKKGEVLGIYGNRGQRQNIVTPGIANIVPKSFDGTGVNNSGYYCVYEIEIRPAKATVRLMATVTKNTPRAIIDVYKGKILPSINKTYRDDGQYYNKTFLSIKVSSNTSEKEIIEFMDNAFRGIIEYESLLNN